MLDQLRADLDPGLIRRPRSSLHAPQQTANPPHARAAPHRKPAASSDPRLAGQQAPPARAPARLRARALHQRPFVHAADIRRPRHRSQPHRQGHAPTCTPDSSASGSHTTANASIGSGIPFSSNSPPTRTGRPRPCPPASSSPPTPGSRQPAPCRTAAPPQSTASRNRPRP